MLAGFGLVFLNRSQPVEPGPALLRQTVSAEVRLGWESSPDLHLAHETGLVLAPLEASQQLQGLVASQTAVRFSLDGDAEAVLTALSAMALPPLVVTLIEPRSRVLTVKADVFIPPAAVAERVQSALADEDMLNLKAEAFSIMLPLAREGLDLLRGPRREDGMPLDDQGHEDDAALRRIGQLAFILESWNRYVTALNTHGSLWDRPQEAYETLNALLSVNHEHHLALLGLAEVLLRLDRPHEAVEAVDAALRLEPRLARAFYVRGLAQLRLSLPALALDDFSRALRLRPSKAAWWRARGAAYMVRHEYDAMCSDLYQACTLGDCLGFAEVRDQGLCPD